MFNYVFNLFIENDLVLSAVKPVDSYVIQLVSITHDLKIFRRRPLGYGCFPDISKAFEKAWRDGIIFRLIQNRRQREVLNGQVST